MRNTDNSNLGIRREKLLIEGFPVFKFKSSNSEEFDDYYARLSELLQSEMHPYKPEFHSALLSDNGIRKTLRSVLSKRSA